MLTLAACRNSSNASGGFLLKLFTEHLFAVKSIAKEVLQIMSRTGENIYKRKDGRWEGRYIKERVNGKARYGAVYAKSYREVKEKLDVAKTKLQKKNCRRLKLERWRISEISGFPRHPYH